MHSVEGLQWLQVQVDSFTGGLWFEKVNVTLWHMSILQIGSGNQLISGMYCRVAILKWDSSKKVAVATNSILRCCDYGRCIQVLQDFAWHGCKGTVSIWNDIWYAIIYMICYNIYIYIYIMYSTGIPHTYIYTCIYIHIHLYLYIYTYTFIYIHKIYM